ncbi:MAG: DNA (cytosine-5-)-methyltransferase [Clostridiales bacterium]|nr:DNA (cytosine-5-)-methyltransferase [Clostridiales bacterium]
MSGYKVASLFAGIGGICLGFKQAGFDIVWANEMDEAACKTYRYNFGNSYLVQGDIRRIAVESIPDFDVLAAGFPCQPFSIAGRQMGFQDARGNLFFEIARIIDKKRPRYVFLENVANLLNHDNGKTFLVIGTTLLQFGYFVKYSLLPANKYGNIPQTRNRIYIVAFRELEDCDMFAFPEPVELTTKVSDIINIHKKQHDIYYYRKSDRLYDTFHGFIKEKGRIYNMFDGRISRVSSGLCPTLIANMGNRKNRVPVVMDDFGYRKLTLRECLAFQGFPNDYYFPKTITIDDAYRQIGNSVCVPVIRNIVKNL